jgi:sn-glycerol 3-phosphate transport system permease protein
MATADLTLVGDDEHSAQGVTATPTGGSSGRRRAGVVAQYVVLCLLALVVIGPLILTVIQALSPPFTYVTAGRPLHPVAVAWKDRTWWSGGALSVIVRTAVIAFLFAWLQKVAAGVGWRHPKLRTPPVLVAVIGGTLVLGFATGPVFHSLYHVTGTTQLLWPLAGLLTAIPLVWGYSVAGRRWFAGATFLAVLTGLGLVSLAVLAAGPEVWTASWTQYHLADGMKRSLVMAVLITVLQVTTSIGAAYAFVFLRFPFKRLIFAVFMATLLLPLEVTLIGNIGTIRTLEWTNTYQALVLPFAAAALGTFLIRQGFRGLPSEIRDATRLDGYGHMYFLTRFAVPLTRPVVASFTVISALSAWNQYLWPRSVITQNGFNTLQIQLRSVAAGQIPNANEAIAAALVAAVPVVIVLVMFQKQIIRGLTAGAVK